MNMDVATLLSNFPEAVSAPLQGVTHELRGQVQQLFNQYHQSLAELTCVRDKGLISPAQFNIELGREKLILEAQMINQDIVIKAALQAAIDTAFATQVISDTADPVTI